MTRVLVYTVAGPRHYTNPAYPGLAGLNADLDESVHLALDEDDGDFRSLNSGTGVLFARADFTADHPAGLTRTLIDPWLIRCPTGGFAVLALRRTPEDPSRDDSAAMLVYRTDDLLHFDEPMVVPLRTPTTEHHVRRPRGVWDPELRTFVLTWDVIDEDGSVVLRGEGTSRRLLEVHVEDHGREIRAALPTAPDALDPHWVPGNTVALTDDEVQLLRIHLDPVRHVATRPADIRVRLGGEIDPADLPRVTCEYSDGSIHEKSVDWDLTALAAIDTSTPGRHSVRGTVRVHDYPFPFLEEMVSDPSIFRHEGRYFLTTTQMNGVAVRCATTIEGLREAELVEVLSLPNTAEEPSNIWAQEMHEIGGAVYVLTTVGKQGWTSVQSVVVPCVGDPSDPESWGEPRTVVRPDGSILAHGGISLDMTYFCIDEVHYVMWSGRRIIDRDPRDTLAETANVYIATIDPDAPWQLTSEPQLLVRPEYGWDRIESPVEEGPYLIRRGDELFVTLAGASTALPDLYCVGLLRARAGRNLLSKDEWTLLPYPVLTKDSVPGQYGPGHNAFIRDPDSGDDLFVFHAVPHDEEGLSLGRRMGIRRVHWGTSGLPHLAMTPERDLPVRDRGVSLEVRVSVD